MRGLCSMIKFNRTAVTYDTLRKECLEAIKQWPGCESIAGIRLIRDTSPAGFSVKVIFTAAPTKGRLIEQFSASNERNVVIIDWLSELSHSGRSWTPPNGARWRTRVVAGDMPDGDWRMTTPSS